MGRRHPDLGASGSLVPAERLLAEATAFRVTPAFVYAYKFKGGNEANGLIPVRIKHANVPKHWDQLQDPEPGTPLANASIGTIPASYKGPSDIEPKESGKPAAALITPDGEDGSGAVDADAPAADPEVAPEVAGVASQLGLEAGDKRLKLLGLLFQKGDLADSVEAYGKLDGSPIEQALPEALSLLDAAAAKNLVRSTDGDEGTRVEFLPTAASPITAPQAEAVEVPVLDGLPTGAVRMVGGQFYEKNAEGVWVVLDWFP